MKKITYLFLALLLTSVAQAAPEYNGKVFRLENAQKDCNAELQNIVQKLTEYGMQILESKCASVELINKEIAYQPVILYIPPLAREIQRFDFALHSEKECLERLPYISQQFEQANFYFLTAFCSSAGFETMRLRVDYVDPREVQHSRNIGQSVDIQSFETAEECQLRGEQLGGDLFKYGLTLLTSLCDPYLTSAPSGGKQVEKFYRLKFAYAISPSVSLFERRGKQYESKAECEKGAINLQNRFETALVPAPFFGCVNNVEAVVVIDNLSPRVRVLDGTHSSKLDECELGRQQSEDALSSSANEIIYSFCRAMTKGFKYKVYYLEPQKPEFMEGLLLQY